MKLRYRDDVHAYWLDGMRCRSVSAVAKIPDDTYALNAWAKRMVAVGMATRPDLADAVAAHHDDRDKLDELVEVAIEAAKANDASRKGTAKHRITERHDGGESILMTPLAEQTIAAWSGLLEAHGLEVVPELIERVAVWPDDRISGRFDRGLRDRQGRLVIADLKTGDRVVDYPHAIAVQLALYAYAPLLAGPIQPAGGETTVFEPMPDFRKDVGYVLHLPDEGSPTLLEVDIAAGWECFQTAIRPTLAWRKRDGLIRPVPAPAVDPGLPERLADIRRRIAGLTDEQKGVLRDRWPVAVPLASITTIAECERVQAAIDELAGFDPPPVERVPPERHRPVTPVEVPTPPAEGPPIDDATYDTLQARYKGLEQDVKAWIAALARVAADAGGPISLTQVRSVRRFEIGRGLVALAESGNADDALIRLFAASAANDSTLDAPSVVAGAAPVSVPAGAVLAALSVDEARIFAQLVDAHLSDRLPALGPDGLYHLAA